MERSVYLFIIKNWKKEIHMPAKKKVDGKKLIKMVESGKLQVKS
jgi:hypothetical protein